MTEFVYITPEHQRHRALFLKLRPIILSREEQLRLHGFKMWMRARHSTGSSSRPE